MKAKLVATLAGFFDDATIARGERYVAEGRVELELVGSERIQSLVRGVDVYGVEIDVRIDNKAALFRTSCDCPLGRDEVRCKHVWATILCAGSQEDVAAYWGACRIIDFANGAVRRAAAPVVSGTDERVASVDEPWRDVLAQVTAEHRSRPKETERRLWYYVLPAIEATDYVLVRLAMQERTKAGGWGRIKPIASSIDPTQGVVDLDDRALLAELLSCSIVPTDTMGVGGAKVDFRFGADCVVREDVFWSLLPRFIHSERLQMSGAVSTEQIDIRTVHPGTLKFEMVMQRLVGQGIGIGWRFTDSQRHQEAPLRVVQVLSNHVVCLEDGSVARLERQTSARALDWFFLLGENGLFVPRQDETKFLGRFLSLPDLPTLHLEAGFGWTREVGDALPVLRVTQGDPLDASLLVEARFRYGVQEFRYDDGVTFIAKMEDKFLWERDRAFERRQVATWLESLGTSTSRLGEGRLRLSWRELVAALPQWIAEGWDVLLEDRRINLVETAKVRVRSGIDWLEVEASATVGDEDVPFPRILMGREKSGPFIKLDDKNVALLSEELLRSFSGLMEIGQLRDGAVRLSHAQLPFAAAFLSSIAGSSAEEAYEELLRRFASVQQAKPAMADPGFRASLRPYQQVGLGWMLALENAGYNGCLADDMGLGKTVQVLALLHRRYRRDETKPRRPSLIVVPRSLSFNWLQEARKFAPELAVVTYDGASRQALLATLESHHVVITTYGLLRLDIEVLEKIAFDYVILDEAQAIKNRSSSTAGAARRLKARHRLALSGTPIENHLTELGSLFEFLNPGLLPPRIMSEIERSGLGKLPASFALIQKALRPLILRRTKTEVLRDLPAKIEQNIFYDLAPEARAHYDELLEHTRRKVRAAMDDPEADEGRTRMHVLEGLLRLRQVACHPALVNPRHRFDDGTKVDVLMEHLRPVLEEGHKALVFSQFVGLLKLIVERLEAEDLAYHYLDGATRNRQQIVESFQSDPEPSIFLISLKAGGVGLNLTAADYVFIMDPWWNPAAEAQAIDRAHRIGQKQVVTSYRLIARETVEEKVLMLQDKKKFVADELLSGRARGGSRLEISDMMELFSL